MESKTLFSHVNPSILTEIDKYIGMNLSHLWMLEKIIEGQTIKEFNNIVNFLVRKDLITPSRKITDKGQALYEAVVSLQPMEVVIKEREKKGKEKKEKMDMCFEHFYSRYPVNDEWGDYPMTTRLKFSTGKETCKKAYQRIISEGEYTEQDMLDILEYKIYIQKKESKLQKKNCMKFLGTINNYLKEARYEGFLSAAKKWKEKKENSRDSLTEDGENLYGKTNAIGI